MAVRVSDVGPRSAIRVSPRQAEILELVANGLPDKEIAARLGVSLRTVRTHLERFYAARGVHDRAAAAATWVRMSSAEQAR